MSEICTYDVAHEQKGSLTAIEKCERNYQTIIFVMHTIRPTNQLPVPPVNPTRPSKFS